MNRQERIARRQERRAQKAFEISETKLKSLVESSLKKNKRVYSLLNTFKKSNGSKVTFNLDDSKTTDVAPSGDLLTHNWKHVGFQVTNNEVAPELNAYVQTSSGMNIYKTIRPIRDWEVSNYIDSVLASLKIHR